MRSAKMAQRWDHIPCNAFILATCIAEACSGDSLSAKNRALSPRAANKDIGSRGITAPDRVFHSWNHSSRMRLYRGHFKTKCSTVSLSEQEQDKQLRDLF